MDDTLFFKILNEKHRDLIETGKKNLIQHPKKSILL